MIEFIFMLTHKDSTVPDAIDVLRGLRGTGLRYVGCKDVGATPAVLREFVARAHDDGLSVLLEVVSTSKADELASLRTAVDVDVDWVLGGTNVAAGVLELAGTGIAYCPFPGRIAGHPSVLEGDIAEIADSAYELTCVEGVHGLDLLTYRHLTADPAVLTKAVVEASDGPVVTAGSIVDASQISTMAEAGAWGFTIGGAIFEGRFPGGPDIADQVRAVLDMAAATEVAGGA
ncbi:MAG TPA: hypothetical protein VH333_04565 [Pseudonocardiaceae bacterium]|jgi:hypothetical protein|nr:hypothetical protein [Pseudonocardiaceae bacterium]